MPKRLTAEDLASGRARVIRKAAEVQPPVPVAPQAAFPQEARQALASIADGIGTLVGGQAEVVRALKTLHEPGGKPETSDVAVVLGEALRRLGEIQEAAQRSLEALREEMVRASSREVVVKIDPPKGPPEGLEESCRIGSALEGAVKALVRAQVESLAAIREVADRVRELAEREIVVQAPAPAAAPRGAETAVELTVTERDAYGRIKALKARRVDS
jgi:hypothetical protein